MQQSTTSAGSQAPCTASSGERAFGVLSDRRKDNVYWFGTQGMIFTSPWVDTSNTVRHPAVLLLTASGKPVELRVGGRIVRHDALALAPLTRRGLRALDVGLVSVHVEPHHPSFPAFRHGARNGVFRMDRRAFVPFDRELSRAYEGRLTLREAVRLFESLVEVAVAQMPAPPPCDERAEKVRALLAEQPDCTLEEIARALDLSYSGASHCCSRALGMPLRAYQQWQKCMRAAAQLHKDQKLTEIAHQAGFSDSAHLSRTWQRSYGLPPSYIRDRKHVQIFL